jgi:hypothetical protein
MRNLDGRGKFKEKMACMHACACVVQNFGEFVSSHTAFSLDCSSPCRDLCCRSQAGIARGFVRIVFWVFFGVEDSFIHES